MKRERYIYIYDVRELKKLNRSGMKNVICYMLYVICYMLYIRNESGVFYGFG